MEIYLEDVGDLMKNIRRSRESRMAIKAQALADFVAESTHEATLELDVTPPKVKTPKLQSSDEDLARWMLFVDGSSNQHGCGAGLGMPRWNTRDLRVSMKVTINGDMGARQWRFLKRCHVAKAVNAPYSKEATWTFALMAK